jgi:2-methylcitrate dehydratase PrpD
MSFAFQLAERACAITLDTLPAEAGRTAKRAVADTIGVALAGSRADFLDRIERALDIAADAGPASKIGRPGRCSALQAAVINGTAAHALDFDDCSTTMGGHPSAPVVPALLALAEDRGASGKAVLSAYLAGVELELRLARAVMPHHYTKGWHPTATLGVFGAAAASAHLLGLGTERMATALAIAVSMASGLKANFGTPVKPLHVGQAASSGVLAATLAEQGVTANPNAFEHAYGFFEVLNGAGTFDPERALGDWLAAPDVLSPGLAIKQHPCCGSAHSAIDAALLLRRQHGPFAADDIVSVETWTHKNRLAHTDRARPRTGLEAKFSVQYLTAKALVAGIIRLGDFEDGAFPDPDATALLDRMQAHAHLEADEYLGRVRVTLRGGPVLEASAATAFGRGPTNPMSDDELHAKFVDCAAASLGAERASALFRAILALDEARDVTAIMTATQPG